LIEVSVPGDKSIGHRCLLLAALARGESRLSGLPPSLDVASTISCLRSLGVSLEDEGAGEVKVTGPTAWRTPAEPLDCGNSGTTARLLTGLLAGLGVEAELRGDASLSARPMDRVVYPLQAMGARMAYVEQPDHLPLRIERRASGALRALRYRPRVSSAQVRGALLLAAVSGRTDLVIEDRHRPRDHSERILRYMGAPVLTESVGVGERVSFRSSGWDGALSPLAARVPGDISSAAFLLVASLLRGSSLTVRSVGLNPSRIAFLRVLEGAGARVDVAESGEEAGEPVGDVSVYPPSGLSPFSVEGDTVPGLIDEIPALAVLASRVDGVSHIRGAAELRVKESDRLALIASNLSALDVRCDESDDGLRIEGSTEPIVGSVRTEGDHRIAMAFAALGAAPGCSIVVDDPDCVDVSFPGFWETLGRVTSGGVER
jgi:3-phosphoshikimate 1-carboxyvinyltransferase